MKILKILSYMIIIAFTAFIFLGYLYMSAQTPHYKVILPEHINGDVIAGSINGNKNIDVYLSKSCIHCRIWEKEHKKDFEEFAKKYNLKITYRNMMIGVPSSLADENTKLFVKHGIFNTPSYVYQDYYYKGAPTPEQIMLLTKKK